MSDSNVQLVLGSSRNPFPQSGSWNMLDISKLPVQATLGILSRYSAARVNPYTALVGEVLCERFQLTTVGRGNLENAVGSLQVVGSLGATLEFGFGVEDVVRTMAKSERGCICLALCAALKECYSDDIAVEVLLEMARLVKVDGQYMPSSQSWKDLLAACAGTLSSSKFPYLAEHLMGLSKGEYRLGAFRRLSATPTSVRSCSSPASLAAALFGLARITRDELRSMSFFGGSDAGWLAAFAEWVLDLKVMIKDSNGQVLYTNATTEKTQVTVVFKKEGNDISDEVSALESTFILKDISEIFEREQRSPDAVVVSGRLEWENILSSTFLSDYKRLTEIPKTFGECIGSAARLFTGLTQAEEAFPHRCRLACTDYSDTAHGAGLVNSAIQWLPELKAVRNSMLKGISQDFNSARKAYEACISLIRSHCNCITCQSNHTGHEYLDDEDEEGDIPMTPVPDSDRPSGSSVGYEVGSDRESVEAWDPNRFCEVVMTETIIVLSRALSNIILEDSALLPTRSGVELVYGRQMNHRLSAYLGRSTLREIGPIAFCLDFDNNFSIGMQVNNEEGIEIRLHSALELFAGRQPRSTNSNYSAVCANGICAFLGIVRASSGDADINSTSRIHILPGRIAHETKSYTMLIDGVQDQTTQSSPSMFPGFANAKEFTQATYPQLRYQLSVRETYTGLEIWMEIDFKQKRNQSQPGRAWVGPSKLAVWLVSRRGLVSCKRLQHITMTGSLSKDCTWKGPVSLTALRRAAAKQTSIECSNKTIDILQYKDWSSTIAAVASTADLDPAYSIFLVDRECLSCCMRTILAIDREERPFFSILQLPA